MRYLAYIRRRLSSRLRFSVFWKAGRDRQYGDIVDSDYAGHLDKCRSITNYAFTCGGGPVYWRSLLQLIRVLSTIEAEYMALMEASMEAIWLKDLVNEMGLKQGLIKLKCDSHSAISLVKNQVFHARTKHIEVRYHQIQDWLNSEKIEVEKFHTNENASDFFNKRVTTEKFKQCLSLLNLKTC